MASQKVGANQDLNKMARAKYETAAQAGLKGYQDAVTREAEIAGVNMQNQIARAQATQQFSNVTGQAAGTYYGNRQQQPKTWSEP
jgi:hypothetical protein